MGVTILMTSELEDRYTDLRFSPFGSAFLADAIVVQRYIEIEGQFKRALSVIKVRGSPHSKDIRSFDIPAPGTVFGDPFSGDAALRTTHAHSPQNGRRPGKGLFQGREAQP